MTSRWRAKRWPDGERTPASGRSDSGLAIRDSGLEDIALIASWVARAMGGQIAAGDPGLAFDSVSIDTRTLTPGALYIGIRGERFDGADFATKAVEAGATGV